MAAQKKSTEAAALERAVVALEAFQQVNLPVRTAAARKKKLTPEEALKAIGDALSAALAAINDAKANGVKIRELEVASLALTVALITVRTLQARPAAG